MPERAVPPPGPMQLPATWSAVASGYASDVVPVMAPFVEESLRLAKVERSHRVLDIATGPGTLAFAAASLSERVDAVDFSPGMIDEIVARTARDGVSNVYAAVMDAGALGFADETFDRAFCLFAFMFFPDRAKAFREMLRVLRPAGCAVIATWAPIERRPLLKLGFDSLAEALPNLPSMPRGDLQHTEECVREMTDAGFRNVSAHVVSVSHRIESAEQYYRFMERSGAPFVVLRKRLGEDVWAAAMKRFQEAILRRIPEGGADFSAEAILTIGVR